jgi:hypothetical protein
MYCLVQIHLADARAATVIEIGPDAHDVIDSATDRMGRTVAEYLRQAHCNSPDPGGGSKASHQKSDTIDQLRGPKSRASVRQRRVAAAATLVFNR